jgi:2Fe-2S ferredoxin
VEQGEDMVEELSDKEEDFIDRAINPRLNSRLSCQCILQEGDGDIIVRLPDQSQFLGE